MTWQPLAGWQIFTPDGPKGAHRRLQQSPQPPHTTPSTPVQNAEPLGGISHVPSVLPGAIVQPPVQQSCGREHTSPGWMQKDTPKEHLPPTQVFEQHCPAVAAVHSLPEVSQVAFSGAHTPPAHVPPQHWPSALHLAPSVMQAAAVHFLFSQRRLQQSVAAEQGSLVTAQVVRTEAQVLLLVSQTPEQQSLPPTQVSLKALQLFVVPLSPPLALLPLLAPLPLAPLSPTPAPVPAALSPASAPLPALAPVPLPACERAPEPAEAERPPSAPLPSPPIPAVPGGVKFELPEPQATPNHVPTISTAHSVRSFSMDSPNLACSCVGSRG